MVRKRLKEGLVQVYFGRGKGKTTAALGQALRATGHGFKVLMIQFMKGNIKYGEITSQKLIPGFEIRQFGRKDLIAEPEEIDMVEGKKAMEEAEREIKSDNWDIIILDEVGVAIAMGIVNVEDVLRLIDEKPPHLEIILTGGPKMHPKLKMRADLVTEMKMVKHYYASQGLDARFGIEF
ncbi:MAG: cob(I)yrinic acid a,c-diamide adenosyltransferase [Candidatus Helarchaeota archaeon]